MTSSIVLFNDLPDNAKQNYGDQVLFVQIKKNEIDVEITASQFPGYIHGAIADLVKSGLPVPTERYSHTVALLGQSDIRYLITIFALIQLGYSVFLVSTRLPVSAVLSLFEETNTNHLVISTGFKGFATQIIEGRPSVKLFDIPQFDRSASYQEASVEVAPRTESDDNKCSLILHSSGSSGNPKPIQHSNLSLGNLSQIDLGVCDGLLCLPLFHAYGLFTINRTLGLGRRLTIVDPESPLTSSNIIASTKASGADQLLAVPYIIKMLFQDDDNQGLQFLKSLKSVKSGGSGLPTSLGNNLYQDEKIHIQEVYGMSEIGVIMVGPKDINDTDWDYLRVIEEVKPYVIWDPVDSKSLDAGYELVVSADYEAKSLNSKGRAFRTDDVFVPHPSRPGLWKYDSRLDDRLAMLNGEKLLPLPIESTIRHNHLVQEVILFGAGKAVPGLLLITTDESKELTRDQLIEAIWPSIKEANEKSEGFAQISKDMIILLPPDTSYPKTDKGTFKRKLVYQHFNKEIEHLYTVKESAEINDGPVGNLELDQPEMETYLFELFESKLRIKLPDNRTDFYSLGVDSLQAIQIWGLLRADLKFSKLPGRNVVYEYPNVESLAKQLVQLRTGDGVSSKDQWKEDSKNLIEKYSNFKPHVPGQSKVEGETVIVTGAAGSLGLYVLYSALKKVHVKTVYALVRAKDETTASKRVISNIENRGLHLTDQEKAKLISLPSDFGDPHLGVNDKVWNQWLDSLTTIIHSAWSVNYHIGIKSFENMDIKGLYNFINLALSVRTAAPARFVFASSISAYNSSGVIPEELATDLNKIMSLGYGQSKFVGENIVYRAARQTGMFARSARIGQIAGDSLKGIWSEKEFVPMMIQTALTHGALPDLQQPQRWTPVDTVAEALVDISGLGSESPPEANIDTRVYNVTIPKTLNWTEQIIPALRKAGLGNFKVVSPEEWVKLLQSGDQDPVKNPAVKLIEFYKDNFGQTDSSSTAPIFSTDHIEKVSKAFRECQDVVSSGLIFKFVDHWKTVWN